MRTLHQKTTAMKLTDLLRRTAEANPQAATLHSIADKAEELVREKVFRAENAPRNGKFRT